MPCMNKPNDIRRRKLTDANTFYLNQRLAQESEGDIAAVAYDVFINGEIARLTKEGQEYFPFTGANLRQAFTQSSDGMLDLVAACFAEAALSGETNAQHLAYAGVVEMVQTYWKGEVRKIVEK